jgi:hypothetical protein
MAKIGNDINYDNSKVFHINLRPRDAVAVVVLAALLNGFSGAFFTWLFQQL